MHKLLNTIVIFVILSGLLVVCSSCKESVPKLEFQPNPETTIPAHFTTYTNEGIFSVSYPPDWEMDLSIIEELESDMKEFGKNIFEADSLEAVQLMFTAGKSFEGYLHPNINVLIEPLPKNVSNTDEVLYAEIKGMKQVFDNFEEVHSYKTIIDGREAAILEFEADLYGTHAHDLMMFMMIDEIIWGITCTLFPDFEDFEDYETDFLSIVRSFRVLD
ncbi:MAG: hypothetical protein GY845_09915 [Planctomycetes bacterium]|nr:hypothetical protein [Planctomycetota bacterium]